MGVFKQWVAFPASLTLGDAAPGASVGMAPSVDSTSPKRKQLLHRVAGVIETVRPMAQSDGGDIELLDVSPDGVVRVRLLGACIGCPSSETTISLGIERALKNRIPEITRVVCV